MQIDHTLADVVVVTETDRRSLGRLWLTLAINVATRMVIGFHLSLDKASAVAVAMVLSQAVSPKDRYLGSGLIDHNQKMTAAAIQIADMKVWAQRS